MPLGLPTASCGQMSEIRRLGRLARRGEKQSGGEIKYSGQDVIQPGAFEYKSPCPPKGAHIYICTVTAKNAKNRKTINKKEIS